MYVSNYRQSTVSSTYKIHDLSDSPLNMEHIRALNTNHSLLDTQLRKEYIRTVVLYDLLDLVETFQEDTVNLVR